MSVELHLPTLQPEPLHAIGAFERDLVVQAGAGTGKTHALVTLYLHLVAGLGARPAPVAPSRILVITFTDKAAGELRDRIRARLAALCDRGLAAEPTLAEASLRLDRGLPPEDLLRRALAELARAPIGTFHALGQGLLRRRATAAGLDPAFTLLDQVEGEMLALDAARGAVLASLGAGDRGTHSLVELMLFGARERTGLVERLVSLRATLAEQGRGAGGIAAAYEAGRIADELASARARLRTALLDLGALAPRMTGLGAQKAELAAALAGSLDEAQADATLKALQPALSNLRASGSARDDFPTVKHEVDEAWKAFADARVSTEAAPLARAVEGLLLDTERRYTAEKRRANVVDFGDLVRLPRDLLRDDRTLAAEEAKRYEAVLVDEFQDTNAVQAELVALLAGDVTPQGGGRRFVVGDRKQSIYEFRGADVGVFTSTTAALQQAGAGELLLRRSFRSSPRVIAACNAIFATAFGAGPPASPWALAFEPARDALEPHRVDAPDASVELLRTLDEDEPRPRADELRRREADAIAAHMRRCLDGGRRAGELALLLRRYTHLPTYLAALRRAGIPHYVVRGRGFYEAPEIRDLASLLQLLADPDQRLALVAVLRSPLCALSDDGLATLALDHQLDARLLHREPTSELAPIDVGRLALWRERLKSLAPLVERAGPAALLRAIVDRFELVALHAAATDGMQRIANVEQLIARAATLESDGRLAADLPGFTRWLGRAVRPQAPREEAEAQIVDERDDVVRVMTIHQSKGLEFPVVYVADVGAKERAGGSPIGYVAGEGLGITLRGKRKSTASRRVGAVIAKRQQAESMRLFYVAATRARDRLVFSGEGSKTSWRAQIDKVQGQLDVVSHRMVAPPLEVPPAPVHALDVPSLAALQPFAPEHARSLRVAVTQLDDFAHCARRYHLVHELGLDETRPAAPATRRLLVLREDDELDARHAGTLAHRLLERARFGLPGVETRAELETLLVDLGEDPTEPGVADILGSVERFLGGSFAQSLAGKAFRRELPFSLALPGPDDALRVLRGQMDLVVFDREGVSVIDYKHARSRPGQDDRLQLEAYALAAATLYPRAPAVRVGFVHLLDEDAAPRWLDVAPTVELASSIAAITERLARARLRGERPLAERTTCDAIECGFVDWCWRGAV